MKAEDIIIIHLSDLHISKKGLLQLHNDLIQDLVLQTNFAKHIVIAVTGDVVDQGDVKGAYKAVLEFFEKLKVALFSSSDRKLMYFGVTPGNHDCVKPRWKNNFNHNTFAPDASAFKKLVKDIYGIFNLNDEGLYGISVKDYDGLKICFARIDSSWHETLDKLRKRSSEGAQDDNEADKRVQLMQKAIQEEAARQRSKIIQDWEVAFGIPPKAEPYLTFALSHLPLTWLGETSTGDLHKFLSGRGFSSVNFWLCGHLHSAKIRHIQDNGFQLTTLMSGVGSDESGDYAQRYSIYRLSLERNVCEIQIRVSHSGRGFIDDLNIGTDVSEYENRHIVMPLKPDKTTSFMPLHTVTSGRLCSCCLDKAMVDCMSKVHGMVFAIERGIRQRIDRLSYEILNDTFDESVRAKDFCGLMIGRRNNEIIKMEELMRTLIGRIKEQHVLERFLSGICTDILNALKSNYIEERTSRPVWRVHFRKYCGKVEQKLLTDDKYAIVALADDHTSDNELNVAQTVSWGGVIEAAFTHKDKVLINSANPELNKVKTKWDDFMTAIPVPAVNQYQFLCYGKASRKFEIRPVLTFGISMMADGFRDRMDASRVLYLLEFFNLVGVVSNGIEVALRRIGAYNSEAFKSILDCCICKNEMS